MITGRTGEELPLEPLEPWNGSFLESELFFELMHPICEIVKIYIGVKKSMICNSDSFVMK